MRKSVGMMKFPIYGKINFMFQTTKHPVYFRGYCGGLYSQNLYAARNIVMNMVVYGWENGDWMNVPAL